MAIYFVALVFIYALPLVIHMLTTGIDGWRIEARLTNRGQFILETGDRGPAAARHRYDPECRHLGLHLLPVLAFRGVDLQSTILRLQIGATMLGYNCAPVRV